MLKHTFSGSPSFIFSNVQARSLFRVSESATTTPPTSRTFPALLHYPTRARRDSMSSPVAAPDPQSFREDARASPERVVLVPVDDVCTQVTSKLLSFVGAHVYRPGDTLLLLHVHPPLTWRADDDAPGAGLANALAAGVSISTLNRCADDADDDAKSNWLDDSLKLLEQSVRERAMKTFVETGVPATAIRCDVAAAPTSNSAIGETICAVARDVDARLVVMAKRGRGALAEALLGSATNRAVRKCACPVLVWNVAPEITEKDGEDADDPAFA